MNELFLKKLHESITPSNKALIESVEQMYLVCEKKAQLEAGGWKNLAAAGAIGLAGLGGGYALHDPIQTTKHEIQQEIKQDAENSLTIEQVRERSQEGAQILEGKKGWHYVDVSQHPGLYSDSFKNMGLGDLDKQKYIQIGWYVSPDNRTYYSTVTGEVYQMPENETFDQATQNHRGNYKGNGLKATGVVSDDELPYCSISLAAHYGKDKECGPLGYELHGQKFYDFNGGKE